MYRRPVDTKCRWVHTHSKEVAKYVVTPSTQKSYPQPPGMSSTFH